MALPKLKSRDVFLVGGITHVPEKDFPEHIDFFGAMSMLLQFRYGLNPSFALRDNEVSLKTMSQAEKKWACYEMDQQSVRHSGLVIADLSVPSTGTGQELEEANHMGVPVIAMAKREVRQEVTPQVKYYVEKTDGEIRENMVQRGSGNISLMVEGNPAIVQPVIIYENNGGQGRTAALKRLDDVLQKEFNLVPITKKLERAVEIDQKQLGQLDDGQEKERDRLEKQIAKNKKRAEMAESLTTFDPIKHDPKEYEKMFPHLKRLPLGDLSAGLTHAHVREIRSMERRPKRVDGQGH